MIYVCPKCGNMTNFSVQASCSCDYNQKTKSVIQHVKTEKFFNKEFNEIDETKSISCSDCHYESGSFAFKMDGIVFHRGKETYIGVTLTKNFPLNMLEKYHIYWCLLEKNKKGLLANYPLEDEKALMFVTDCVIAPLNNMNYKIKIQFDDYDII